MIDYSLLLTVMNHVFTLSVDCMWIATNEKANDPWNIRESKVTFSRQAICRVASLVKARWKRWLHDKWLVQSSINDLLVMSSYKIIGSYLLPKPKRKSCQDKTFIYLTIWFEMFSLSQRPSCFGKWPAGWQFAPPLWLLLPQCRDKVLRWSSFTSSCVLSSVLCLSSQHCVSLPLMSWVRMCVWFD